MPRAWFRRFPDRVVRDSTCGRRQAWSVAKLQFRRKTYFTHFQSSTIRKYGLESRAGSAATGVLLLFTLGGVCATSMPDLTSVYESFLIHAESANTTEAWFGRSKTIYSPNEQRKKKSYKEFMDTEDSEDSASHLSIPGEGHAESRPPDRHSPSPESSIFPIWLKSLPGFIRKLQSELSMAPGSLAEELWREANDPECNPEIIWDAHVRISEELCDEEEAFLRKRRPFTRAALARYLNLSEKDIHEDDVPTIAICSSGGGLRALVAGTGSYLATKEDGLFDCVTYTAGVSGSCWLQALYYSSIIGQSHARLVQHLKNRLGTHITFPPTALSLLCSAPTNRYLLSGVLEKKRGDPKADFGLVDIYGILLAARLMVPKGDLAVNEHDLKISNQRRYIDAGQNPLPIYTAVRHEVPLDSEIAKARDDKHQTLNEDAQKRVTEKAKQESWFEWFECTPYEFFSEDLGAGIPTYALGRPFVNGRTQWRENGLALPELRLPLLMGIWGSAFCATLSHYWKEIRPIIKTLAGFSESGLEAWIESQDEEMGKVHPIDPAEISNFVEGMGSRLRANVPETMTNSKTLELMDAGMSNNLPIYPLLRPGRNVDVLITFDVSADIKQENWIGVADGYVKQRGIKGWPIGAGWPREDKTIEQTTHELEAAQAASSADARAKLDKAKHASASNKQQTPEQTHISPIPGGRSTDLGYCTVWVGAAEESTSPLPSSSDSSSPSSSSSTPAGLTLVYFPLICNPSVPTLDPQAPAPPFLSTWNFVYTPDEVDRCVALARANFREGAEQTRRAIRAVYERKRGMRLTREKRLREEEEERWRGSGRGRGHVGDAFS